MINALIRFKRNCPHCWHRIEMINGVLFQLRYRKRGRIAETVLDAVQVAGCRFSLLKKEDLPELERFLARQDEENLKWFHPHAFDGETLKWLSKNPAFLMMQVTAPDGSMVGYFFLRGFFIGRAFAGLIVDKPWQNQGIGTAIWAACADICQYSRLRMQATISTENKPSMASCRKGTDIQEMQALEDNYLAVECKQKK